MILLTGAAGFIGSRMLAFLNAQGRKDIAIVDKFEGMNPAKAINLEGTSYRHKVEREQLFSFLLREGDDIDFIIHLGARTDTMSTDGEIFRQLNFNYTQSLFLWAAQQQVPIIYASSAATYGAGEKGYSDQTPPSELRPLNKYAESKNEIDIWVKWLCNMPEDEQEMPPFWAGLKFFNVYGRGEQHKGRMASVVHHASEQLRETGKIQLFRSHKPDFADGEQMRDFVSVEDVCEVIYFMLKTRPQSGIYNVGTGKARSFKDLALSVCAAMGISDAEQRIEWVDMPENLREKYQYFTEAEIPYLRKSGYRRPFLSIEEGAKLALSTEQEKA